MLSDSGMFVVTAVRKKQAVNLGTKMQSLNSGNGPGDVIWPSVIGGNILTTKHTDKLSVRIDAAQRLNEIHISLNDLCWLGLRL